MSTDWRSVRKKMVKSWSKRHEDLWLDTYANIRRTYDPDDPNDQIRAENDATSFYEQRREEMLDIEIPESLKPQHSIDATVPMTDKRFMTTLPSETLSVVPAASAKIESRAQDRYRLRLAKYPSFSATPGHRSG